MGEGNANTHVCILPLCNNEDIEELIPVERRVLRQTIDVRIEQSTLSCNVLSAALNLRLEFQVFG
jgi:hypothetical protein